METQGPSSKNPVMRIRDFIWPNDRVEHIARHSVTPEEVEEVCYGKAFVRRAKSMGDNPV
jgi:hypothetical protein